MEQFAKLSKALERYQAPEQIEEVIRAYRFAKDAHGDQKRVSGEPYIIHPVAVATILAEMHLDVESIQAALLHDVIEDTHFDKDAITEHFGDDVALLVDGVSKLTQIEFESRAEAQAENFRKMMIAMANDIRVILIKLADRLHNMSTIHFLVPEKRHRIARETLEIYAPIANRLGMHNVRLKFEGMGFKAAYPLRYRILAEALRKARGHRQEIVEVIEASLDEALHKAKFKELKLWGREKHIYSIYKKMRNKHLSFTEVMDVYAFRIIVDTVDDCYRVLGVVHNLYKPLPGKVKDYIAIPKANGYQSIHTILFGPYGVPIEIQIRTEAMDRMAESGIAAHWLYKNDEQVVDQAQLRAREWIKGLLEIQQSAGNSLEFIENVKIDLFPDEVYVFTPQGDIMKLPHGGTAVDFAYAVHSDVGNRCVAVKIDRKIATLSTLLKNGQTVEIITAKDGRPSPMWLDFVATGKARSKIRHFLKSQKRDESVALGLRLFDQALRLYHLSVDTLSQAQKDHLLMMTNLAELDDLYEAIGLGNQVAQLVAQRLMQSDELELTGSDNLNQPLQIKGSEGTVVSFAKCCHPIPLDPIMGVLTSGKGLVIHHAECRNLREFRKQPDKCIRVAWEKNLERGEFEVELHIYVENQIGVLAHLALSIADAEASINNVNIQEQDGHFIKVTILITVHDRNHLASVVRRLRQMKMVSKVSRARNL